MTVNRFGASPLITGNVSTLKFAAAALDTVWPNQVVTPVTLNIDSPDQFLIRTKGDGTASVINIPAASAQMEGKTFFIKLAVLAAGGDTVGVVLPGVGTVTLTTAGDFASAECLDTTPVGATVSTYAWFPVLAVVGGAWV